MQKMSVKNLKPGMVVARNIFDITGTLLLGAGVKLNVKIINSLNMLNLGSVYIKNPLFELAPPELEEAVETAPEIIREKTRNQAVDIIRGAFGDMSSTTKVNVDKIKQAAALLIDEIVRSIDALIYLTDIRTYDDQTFAHSVNVAAIATMLGMQSGYNRKQLNELALGALLHDVGKMLIPPEILLKPGKLTDEEWVLVKQHPALGFEILRKNPGIPATSSCIAYLHHEKVDGTGYCSSLKSEEIHEYARIVSIADVYEALTSDRCYRKGLLPHQAYEIMQSMAGTHFDYILLTKFLNKLVIYPVGSTVKLSNGYFGIVEKVLSEIPLRPVVRVIAESETEFFKGKSFSLDLNSYLNITIEKVLSEDEVCELMTAYQRL